MVKSRQQPSHRRRTSASPRIESTPTSDPDREQKSPTPGCSIFKMRQIQGLELGGTKVTDAGLVHLQGLSQLQRLDLHNTKVTEQVPGSSSKHCRSAGLSADMKGESSSTCPRRASQSLPTVADRNVCPTEHTARDVPWPRHAGFGSRASTIGLGRAITWAAISFPRSATLALPASTAAVTAERSPRMITVI